MVPFLLKALHVPSRELTCPLPRHVWVDDFPFPMVGYVIVTWRVILCQKTAETPKNLSYQEEIYEATGQSKQLRDGMDRVEGDNFHGFIFCYLGNLTTVNGINPPPIDIINIPVFIGFYTSQLAQDFSYQQYGSWIPCSFWIRYLLSNMVIFQAAMIVFGGGIYIYTYIMLDEHLVNSRGSRSAGLQLRKPRLVNSQCMPQTKKQTPPIFNRKARGKKTWWNSLVSFEMCFFLIYIKINVPYKGLSESSDLKV